MKDNPKIVIFGSGVIGSTVGGWIAPHHDELYFFDMPKVVDALNKNGITLYEGGKEGERETVQVKTISDLSQAKDADAVVVAVKNYSLDAVAKTIRDAIGDGPIIIAMQNGLLNQEILPKYFSKVIYCVVSYNAWANDPGVFGYQKRGPLEWGTLDNSLLDEQRTLAAVFDRGVPVVLTDRISDAAHCKLVLNLSNSLTTLIGHTYKPVTDMKLFQKLLSNLLYEGVKIVKAAGVREVKLGGLPPWVLIRIGATLPYIVAAPMFKKNVKKMVISSMAQDIIQRGAGASELDTINGTLLNLAKKHCAPAPYNQAIYDLCVREFGKDKFEPMDLADVWAYVSKQLP